MCVTIIPFSPETVKYCTMLFHVNKKVTVIPELFDESWPCIDSVYSKLQFKMIWAHGTARVQKCECRRRKSKKSNIGKEALGKVIKRRHSSIYNEELFHIRIKVLNILDSNWRVMIERLYDYTIRMIFQRATKWTSLVFWSIALQLR